MHGGSRCVSGDSLYPNHFRSSIGPQVLAYAIGANHSPVTWRIESSTSALGLPDAISKGSGDLRMRSGAWLIQFQSAVNAGWRKCHIMGVTLDRYIHQWAPRANLVFETARKYTWDLRRDNQGSHTYNHPFPSQ